MINKRDVIKLFLPYPSISSKLAVSSHMYIVSNEKNIELIKCQTLKPYMINSSQFRKYVDVHPNSLTNPFVNITRIDCEKLFKTYNVSYDDGLKANRNIEENLYNKIITEMYKDEDITYIDLNEDDLVQINELVNFI